MMIAEDDRFDVEQPPAALPRPLAREWLWRPWYAKAWWASMMAYWPGKIASFSLPALEAFYTSALAGVLNFAFFPTVILLILGLGFARAWFAWSDWEWVQPTDEQMFPRRSIGGLRDPYSDPLDPASGMLHWKHFHPDN